MKKELLISAKFDTSDFDKSVERMQNRLKDLYAPSDMVRAQTQTNQRLQQIGMGDARPGVSQDQYQKTQIQTKRQLDTFIKEEVKDQEKLTKMLVNREAKIKSLQEQQKLTVKNSKEELEIKEKINKLEENNFRAKEYYKQREATINQALDARKKVAPNDIPSLLEAFKGGGFKYGMSQVPGAFRQNPMGMGASVMGGIGAAAGLIGGIGSAAEQFTGYGMRLESARGSAVAGTTGKDLAEIYGGRSPFEAAYMPERTEAAGLAAQKAGRNRVTDRLKGIGSIGGLVAGGGLVLGGLATGAASLAGMPFTAGGSALGLPAAGAMIAGGAGMIGGGVAGLSNDRSRKGILGGKEYEQLLASQQAKDFRQTLDDLKEQDPGKKLALEDFEKNYQKNVQSQRMLGLSNKEFYGEGGFKQKAAAAGFMPEQAIGMAQSIVGAGGSARMGRSAEFGLQMERAGISNAGNILGAMSGSIQSPESTKRATISIISEAFKIGLDNTEFAEENRRFTQAAANIIGKSGATSETDQDRLTQTLGMFLGERSNRGVEASQTAYERFQERGSQLGGRRGAMRFAAARQDQNLGKLGTAELTELLGMRPEDIREDTAVGRTFAKEAGFEGKDAVKQLQDKLKALNKQSRFLVPSNAKKVQEQQSVVEKYMKENGLNYTDLAEKSRKGELPSDVDYAYGKMQIATNIEEKGGLQTATSEAATGEFLEGVGPAKGGGKAGAKALLEGPTGRLEDTFTRKAAEGADEARKNFNAMTNELNKAAAATKDFVGSLAPLADQLRGTAVQRQAVQPKGNATGRDIVGPILQTQAGKPKGP
jgi:hypothetical protein